MQTWNPKERYRCHDCDVLEGEYHKPGCDMERCPFCLGQLISCDCSYELLGVDVSPGTWAYSNGLTEAQADEWQETLEETGRIRFVLLPNLCARCGQAWPQFFMDKAWKTTMPLDVQPQILCHDCYEVIKGFILQSKEKP